MTPIDIRPMVQQMGTRRWGFMAWRAWAEVDQEFNGRATFPMSYQREGGTYAWTRRSAERKATRLVRHYLRHQWRGEPYEAHR